MKPEAMPSGVPGSTSTGAPTIPVADARPSAPKPGPGADVEIGGPTGPEPTRYGDWERGGRCSDF